MSPCLAPFALVFGKVDLSSAQAARIAIARQPILSEARPSSGASFDIRLADIQIAHLEIAESVAGEAGQFSAAFALDLRGRDLRLLKLDLARLDSDLDRAAVLPARRRICARRRDRERAGGVLARLLGFTEEGFAARARAKATPKPARPDTASMSALISC